MLDGRFSCNDLWNKSYCRCRKDSSGSSTDRFHSTVVEIYMCLYYFLRGTCPHGSCAHASPQRHAFSILAFLSVCRLSLLSAMNWPELCICKDVTDCNKTVAANCVYCAPGKIKHSANWTGCLTFYHIPTVGYTDSVENLYLYCTPILLKYK